MTRPCDIRTVGKRRDGKNRYWCVSHGANATGPRGVRQPTCEKHHEEEVCSKDVLILDPTKYAGGIALWGAVPAVYTTATHDLVDTGVHVHARRRPRKKKLIDHTYQKVIARLEGHDGTCREVVVNAEDAIAYMVSSVFGRQLKSVDCPYCGRPHLDKDWFAVSRHQTHLCYGCGRSFRDTEKGIGNPLMTLKSFCGDEQVNRSTVPAPRTLDVAQKDFPLGIELWGSHEAILWTSTAPEESGIHFHGYTSNFMVPSLDETFDAVAIDGIKLEAMQVRVLMAQKVLPHLEGRLVALVCPRCGSPHFDIGDLAYTPHTVHTCVCGCEFQHSGRMKKVVSNPMIETLKLLGRAARL